MRRRDALGLLLGSAAALPILPAAAAPVLPRPTADDLIGEPREHVTDHETTLLDIARRHDLGVLEILAVNPGIDPWVPGAGRTIVLPTAHVLPDAPREGVVINKAELRLYYFPKLGPVETHAIGVGREGFDTPLGQTRIVRKQKDPVWRPTDSTRRDRPELPAAVLPGPENPLGDRAMYLSWPTYAVHGTNKPYGVGRRVSRGCIRMYPETARRLYEQVQPGTRVTVVDQPVKLGRRRGELYLEAHPDFQQLDQLEEARTFIPKPPASDLRALVRLKAGGDAARVDWALVEDELIRRRGIPVRITLPPGTPPSGPRIAGHELPPLPAAVTRAPEAGPAEPARLDDESALARMDEPPPAAALPASEDDALPPVIERRPLTGLY